MANALLWHREMRGIKARTARFRRSGDCEKAPQKSLKGNQVLQALEGEGATIWRKSRPQEVATAGTGKGRGRNHKKNFLKTRWASVKKIVGGRG